MTFQVASFGDLVVDIVAGVPALPVEAARDQLLDYVRIEPGGAGNFLITGQRLGMHMRAGGAVGEDAFGSMVLQILQEERVDVSAVHRLPGGTTTTVVVLVDRLGNHVFLGRSGEGPEVLLGAWVNAFLKEIRALQVWGYTFMERPLVESMLQLVEVAHQRQIPVFFDPGPQLRASAERLERLLRCTRVILLTEAEIPLVTEGRVGIEGIEVLLERGPGVVVVKQGVKGCTVYTRTDMVVAPGFPVSLHDTTGAGDAFAAAFIYGYLQGWSLPDVATFANATGAAKVQKIGSGRQVPTADEIRQVLRTFRIDIDF
ncbi:PfkB family carbohydrate kinase [uncultured Thermanaerothrix sp.]|uniref:PfkB family carbohydrate kinase n=1 Tax=uncultured Thermanaerothrix sp. TaxID=1195149 RepID=UPI00262E27D5|nr:PfkB family carbohydrate kinase [uncultured Thermanaerothrix sp.]